jgi:hypothetical protein
MTSFLGFGIYVEKSPQITGMKRWMWFSTLYSNYSKVLKYKEMNDISNAWNLKHIMNISESKRPSLFSSIATDQTIHCRLVLFVLAYHKYVNKCTTHNKRMVFLQIIV